MRPKCVGIDAARRADPDLPVPGHVVIKIELRLRDQPASRRPVIGAGAGARPEFGSRSAAPDIGRLGARGRQKKTNQKKSPQSSGTSCGCFPAASSTESSRGVGRAADLGPEIRPPSAPPYSGQRGAGWWRNLRSIFITRRGTGGIWVCPTRGSYAEHAFRLTLALLRGAVRSRSPFGGTTGRSNGRIRITLIGLIRLRLFREAPPGQRADADAFNFYARAFALAWVKRTSCGEEPRQFDRAYSFSRFSP